MNDSGISALLSTVSAFQSLQGSKQKPAERSQKKYSFKIFFAGFA
jgi:hypothetical protein